MKINTFDIKRYLAALIFTSLVHIKKICLYWHDVVELPCIKKCLPQRQFECVRRVLHFNDNSAMILDVKDTNYDCLYKVRPIIEHFNRVSGSIPLPHDLSVDKNICGTKMHSSLHQYNPKNQ